METLKELLEKRASLIGKQDEVIKGAKKESRSMNETEETRFDDLQVEIDALEPKIKRAKIIEARQKDESEAGEDVSTPPAVHTEKRQSYSLNKAIRSVLQNGKVDGLEAEMTQEAENELRASGLDAFSGAKIAIPSSMMEERGQSVLGNGGVKGGKLVVTETPLMVSPLFPNNPLTELGLTHLSGLKGNVPLLSNTDVAFTWAGETENVAAKTDAKFEGPVLKPKRIVAIVDISEQLVLQSAVGVEALVIGLLNDAYGRALASATINGSGGKEPTGILNIVGVGDSSYAGKPTYGEVVKLETMIDAENATEKSLAYVTTKQLKGALKTTAKVEGTDSIMLSDGKTLNGSKLVSSNLVPELTEAHPLIYGDWSQVFTGQWGGLSIKVDPLTQATSGKIRLIVNAYADVQVVHPKAFAYSKKFSL